MNKSELAKAVWAKRKKIAAKRGVSSSKVSWKYCLYMTKFEYNLTI